MRVEIILERHGESLGNAKKMYLGNTDLDLSELGYKQAEFAAKALLSERIDAIYSSDLKRAYNTAAAHARLRKMQITAHKGMRELYIGDWEGLTVYELIEKYGELFTVGWQKHFGSFKAPGGESVEQLANRVHAALVEIAKKHKDGEKILVATHAAAIRSLYGKISGFAPDEVADKIPFPLNASFTRIVYDGEKLLPISYSKEK